MVRRLCSAAGNRWCAHQTAPHGCGHLFAHGACLAAWVAPSQHLTTLTHLQLRSWDRDLTYLKLYDTVARSAELCSFKQFISGLAHLASLHHLSLPFSCHQQFICRLSGALRHLESLRSLELPMMPLDSVTLKPVLAAIRCMPWLQRLALSGDSTKLAVPLSERSVGLIARELQENRNIRVFEVYECGDPAKCMVLCSGPARKLRACWEGDEDPLRFRRLPV